MPAFLTSAFMGATYSALFVFHQPFALALGAKRLGAFFVGFTAAAMLMRLGFGGLGDRIGHRRAVMLSLVLYSAVPLAVAHMNPSLLWAYGAAFGLAHGVAYPTAIAYATERAPRATRGRVIGVFSAAFNVGSSTGALTWGYVASHAGYPALFFAASATIASGLLALGVAKDPARP
jgi:MFS family permease